MLGIILYNEVLPNDWGEEITFPALISGIIVQLNSKIMFQI